MSELEKEPTPNKDGVISTSLTIDDLTEQELAWYKKRVNFFEGSMVAVSTKMLLMILKEGRKPNCL